MITALARHLPDTCLPISETDKKIIHSACTLMSMFDSRFWTGFARFWIRSYVEVTFSWLILFLSGFSPTGTSNDEWHIDTLHQIGVSKLLIFLHPKSISALFMQGLDDPVSPSLSPWSISVQVSNGRSQVFCHGDILEAIRRQVDRGPRYQVVDMPSFLAVRLMGEVYVFKEPGNTKGGNPLANFLWLSCGINVL